LRAPLSILLIALALTAVGTPPKATFTENKGQWPAQVLYRAHIPGGVMFVERSAFTYVLFSESPLAHHGHAHQPEHVDEGKAHAYRVNFEGGHASSSAGALKQKHYENYFIDNDPAQWGTGCGVFGVVTLHDVWPGIDLRISGADGIKYDFILAPGADPGLVRMRYEGQDGIELRDGSLIVKTSVGDVVEGAPISFREDPIPLPSYDPLFHRVQVSSSYLLSEDLVRFVLEPSQDRTLIIDPTLTFASFTGSTADNFGCTATYDNDGHLYGGGIVFNAGYPVTVGVLQNFWAGGTIDVGISKWSPDGTSLVWSTYLGGSTGAESPHSLVVNEQDELYVMGTTGSSNFPTTPGAFDGTFGAGGGAVSWTNIFGGYGYQHLNGCDVFVAHFNVGATSLIGSTFMGGVNQDGLNNSTTLTHNYGDHIRGEIALDPGGNPVVATSTYSAGLPTTPGAPQPLHAGAQDGFVFRMDPALTVLQWATYIGGAGDDSAYGVQFDSGGNLFVTGGTTTAGLAMPGVSADNSYNGGGDGYIMRYSGITGGLLSGTYLGTSAYDQSYFVQVDTDDAVYVTGQTHGNYPVTPGKYSNPGSSQFIHKFNNALSASQWSTVIGNGVNTQDMSPTAFLVSDCGQVYFSGWAGNTNANAGNNNSTTSGSAITPDAFQSITDGSDNYLLMLNPDAVSLSYATFFGGPNSDEHVDGGTSRFDKDGTVYQAVCAGCLGQDDFPTTPGAWSITNNSPNCSLGVFKFELAASLASIGIDGPNVICFPSTVQFTNSSTGGDTYLWDFGDGGTSTEFEPAHLYTEEGVFTVSMLMTDSYGCTIADTADIQVIAIPTPAPTIDPVVPICPGANTQLFASGGLSWAWFPAIGVSDTTIADPVVTPPEPMTYSVIIENDCGSDTASVQIDWIDPVGSAGQDTSTCLGSGVALDGSGGGTYMWEPATTLNDATLANPIASPTDSTYYSVIITTPDGCTVLDTVLVTVYIDPPTPALFDTTICEGASVQLVAGDAAWFSWRPATGISDLNVQDPVVTPPVPALYIADLFNPCGTTVDSAFVDLYYVNASAWPDTLVCPGQPVYLQAAGGDTYAWTPSAGLSHPDSSYSTAIATTSTLYSVTVTDINGCSDVASVQVDLLPLPAVQAGRDVTIDFGEVVQLTATGGGTLTWSPSTWLNDSTSASPISRPEESITYTVTVTDATGCKNSDALVIILNGTLFVPNSFTPDGDGFNDFFGALGKDLREVELLVFNRWGELIWSTSQLDGRWDGTYQGVDSPIDTYVWKVKATEISGRERQAVGHVNLLR